MSGSQGTARVDATRVALGKGAGRAEFGRWLESRQTDLSPTAFEKAYHQVRKAADAHGEVTDRQLQAIVDDVVADMEVFEGVAASFRAFR